MTSSSQRPRVLLVGTPVTGFRVYEGFPDDEPIDTPYVRRIEDDGNGYWLLPLLPVTELIAGDVDPGSTAGTSLSGQAVATEPITSRGDRRLWRQNLPPLPLTDLVPRDLVAGSGDETVVSGVPGGPEPMVSQEQGELWEPGLYAQIERRLAGFQAERVIAGWRRDETSDGYVVSTFAQEVQHREVTMRTPGEAELFLEGMHAAYVSLGGLR